MIYYLVTAAHRYTIDKLLAALPERYPVEIVPLTYEKLFRDLELRPATFIFSDTERLIPKQQERAARVWNKLERSGWSVRLLNNPILAMRRYELLRELHERGVNEFDVYRLTEARRPKRYPVFIRGEQDHRGSHTQLLRSEAELDSALRRPDARGKSRDQQLIVEHHAAADERGYYRKYSAFFVDGLVIPRHVVFGKHWVVKRNAVEVDEGILATEREYLTTNPHAGLIREVFELARIGFGRIDYGVVDGRVQVYDINTNPTLYGPTDARFATSFPTLTPFVERLGEALAALDRSAAPTAPASPAAGGA